MNLRIRLLTNTSMYTNPLFLFYIQLSMYVLCINNVK